MTTTNYGQKWGQQSIVSSPGFPAVMAIFARCVINTTATPSSLIIHFHLWETLLNFYIKLVQCWDSNILWNEVKVCWWPGYWHCKVTGGQDDTWDKRMHYCLKLGRNVSNFITILRKDVKFKHMINFTSENSAQNGFEDKLGYTACIKHQ